MNKVGESPNRRATIPDILLSWGKAEVTTWTHKINGLTESDFHPGGQDRQVVSVVRDRN